TGLLVWTVTRETFDPKLYLTGPDGDPQADPCIEIGAPKVLSKQDINELVKLLGKDYRGRKPTAACEIPITIFERHGDKQLDIGPLQRTFKLSSDGTFEPHRVVVNGLIRGDVRLFGGDERDRIALGSFNRGAKKTVSLITGRSDVELEIDKEATSSEL